MASLPNSETICAEPRSNFVERLVPGNALERPVWPRATSPASDPSAAPAAWDKAPDPASTPDPDTWPPWRTGIRESPDAPDRPESAWPARLPRDQNAAGIRTIVRTGGMHNLLHRGFDYNLEKSGRPGAARWNTPVHLDYGSSSTSRTRCAHSTASPLTESFRTRPRATTPTEAVALAVPKPVRVKASLLPWREHRSRPPCSLSKAPRACTREARCSTSGRCLHSRW